MQQNVDHVFEVGDWFISLCSYGDCCSNENPCPDCLEMCNRYVVSGRHKTTTGYDYFFGGHYVTKEDSCILTEPTCYVMTSDKHKALKTFGVMHVSGARPIELGEVRQEDRY